MGRERGKFAKQRTPNGKTRTGLKVLIVVLSLILLFILVLAVGLSYVLGQVGEIKPVEAIPPEQQQFETDPTIEGESTAPHVSAEDVEWDEVEKLYNQDIINVLLIGQDRREGEVRARSDSMILVSVNTVKNTIQMTSFMRDLYVQIPGGYADNRINAAYSMGGAELLDATLEKNFGIQVDGNIEVDFNQFEAIVDILGGVDVEMNSEESGYMNRYFSQLGTTSEGMNHLGGEQALHFARMRRVTGSDFGRTERQRRLLSSIAGSLKSIGLNEVKRLIDEVLPYVTTDLSNAKLLDIASRCAQIVAKGSEIATGRVPADDAYYDATIRGMMVLVPDLTKCQSYLQDFIYAK